ncbi:MAG: OmpA family protein [Nitrospinae bacterium]|nr:OmpA family protein [Nitrospinota bacterium]
MADPKKDGKQPIIIKKVKKGHGGAHGGSWKVAYADFVTAMMAFFLLLWLLAMVSPEKRIVMAEYFKQFSVFKESGSSFFEGTKGIVAQPGGNQQTPQNMDLTKGAASEVTAEQMKDKITGAVTEKFDELKDQVMIDIFEGGVRIQLVDKEGSRMFEPGSVVPTEKCKRVMKMISDNIKETTNRVALEGHTDATPYNVNGVTNWEISANRALSARKLLEENGIDPYRIARVVGYADTEPLIKYNPRDERNRRISLILLYEKKHEKAGVMRVPELSGNSPEVNETPPAQSPGGAR